jgi:prophage regulatory protein
LSLSQPQARKFKVMQATHHTKPVDFLLSRKQVEYQAGISRASIYRLIKAGKFPAPYSLNTGAVRWKQSDITAWQLSLTKTA